MTDFFYPHVPRWVKLTLSFYFTSNLTFDWHHASLVPAMSLPQSAHTHVPLSLPAPIPLSICRYSIKFRTCCPPQGQRWSPLKLPLSLANDSICGPSSWTESFSMSLTALRTCVARPGLLLEWRWACCMSDASHWTSLSPQFPNEFRKSRLIYWFIDWFIDWLIGWLWYRAFSFHFYTNTKSTVTCCNHLNRFLCCRSAVVTRCQDLRAQLHL